MSSRPAPSLALLSAITALAFCGLHMVVPALPLLVAVFTNTPAHVQLVVSLYLAGIAAGQLVYGPVSDRFGRRPVLLAGLAAFLAGTALCGAAWSLPALIAGRVLQALGACAGSVLSRAMIRDVYEREAAARGLALVMMAMTLAPAISPALGAYLAEWFGWRAIFAVLGGLGGVVLVATVIRLPLSEEIENFFDREVPAHVPDAWIDTTKRDQKDGEIGIVGHEINFNRYFYRYNSPRRLEEIEADIRGIEADIVRMLGEITGSAVV